MLERSTARGKEMTTFVDIDITDSKRTNGYVHYLIALQNLDPICLDMPISNGHQPLVDEMKRVCNLIEDYLPKCEPHNLCDYISSYSMIYTFGKLKRLDPKLLDDLDYRILDAWMDGDKRISDIEAYSIIASHFSEVQSDLRSWYQRKQAQFFLEIDENANFARLSPLENYRTLNALWNDGIWNKYPDCTYGKGDIVFMNYEEVFDKLDTETLHEYYLFYTRYAINEPTHRIKLQREVAILTELSKRDDLDEYDRKGYEFDKQVVEQLVANDFENEIADIAHYLSAARVDKKVLADLSVKFEGILTDMFDELPQFIDTEDENLEFKGGKILAPISNESLLQIVDIHYKLLNSDVAYDEFIFTNALGELEQRTNNGDAVAHEIVAHYDDLYHKYNK
jgi:hypothetical protein